MDQASSLAVALMMGAGALIGKIVWDWLSNKRTAAKHEGDCARLTALENQFHAAHLALAQDVATVKGDIGMIKNDLNYIKKKLDLNGSSK